MPVTMQSGWWRGVLLLGLIWAALALIPTPGRAQACHVSGSFGMNFGPVTADGAMATGTVTVGCRTEQPSVVHFRVCVYLGYGSESTGGVRRMTNYNGSYLHYGLYQDPSHELPIGPEGSTPVYALDVTLPGSGTNVTYMVPIYGWVFPEQTVPANHTYQESGIQGMLVYRYGTAADQLAPDCSSGGLGGSSVPINSSTVMATYANSCRITATDLDFGQVPPPTQRLTQDSSIRVQCPPETAWRIGLSDGQSPDAGMRRMSGSGGYVIYQLFRNPERTEVWGNTNADMVSGTTGSSGTPVDVTVYGAVPPQPDAAIGQYSDTVIATLYY